MASVTAEQQWKDRYRELVRDFEDKEREWGALEKALRSAAGKLAFAAMGQNGDLDAALEDVMAALRTDLSAPQLDASLSGVVRALQLRSSDEEPEQPPAVAPSAQTGSSPAEPAPAAVDVLRELAAIISGRPGLAELAKTLERCIDACVPAASWAPLLEDVADAIARHVEDLQSQRRELEEFLEQVTRQLSELESWTTWQQDVSQDRRTDSLDLEDSVREQMTGLHREVEESPDLVSLKSKVQKRLDTVTQRLLTFRDSEERRHAESERRTNELRTEVAKLKGKTAELLEICADQESRLMIDSLTAVHSRYAYERRLQEEFQRWRRHAQPLTFSMWDIDFFKKINDSYGHDAGDRLLRGVADILGRRKRAEDFLARIGGEEFVLLLPMTKLDWALPMADKLRAAIETAAFRHQGKAVPVTISCGLTEFRDGDTPESVYERADRALYQAKEQGRNRCVVL